MVALLLTWQKDDSLQAKFLLFHPMGPIISTSTLARKASSRPMCQAYYLQRPILLAHAGTLDLVEHSMAAGRLLTDSRWTEQEGADSHACLLGDDRFEQGACRMVANLSGASGVDLDTWYRNQRSTRCFFLAPPSILQSLCSSCARSAWLSGVGEKAKVAACRCMETSSATFEGWQLEKKCSFHFSFQ